MKEVLTVIGCAAAGWILFHEGAGSYSGVSQAAGYGCALFGCVLGAAIGTGVGKSLK